MEKTFNLASTFIIITLYMVFDSVVGIAWEGKRDTKYISPANSGRRVFLSQTKGV